MNSAQLSENMPFGRLAVKSSSPLALLRLEHEAQKLARFRAIDAVVGHLLMRLLRGERIADLTFSKVKNAVKLSPLSPEERQFLESEISISALEARGTWSVPKEVTLRIGWLNLPHLMLKYGRFATTMALEERGKVPTEADAATVLIWSILEPLATAFLQPLEIRGPDVGKKSREEQLKQWQQIDAFFGSLNFSLDSELTAMRYGNGWHKLRAAQQLEVKQRFIKALGTQVRSNRAAYYRAYKTLELLERYYSIAKDGKALRKRVLTKAFEPTIVGFFKGDWLYFLDYLEETPHPDEQVVQAIPTPRFYATGASKAAEAAQKLGIPVEEATRIVGAYFGQDDGKTPIEERVSILSKYWEMFSQIHASQTTESGALWGLVEEETKFQLNADNSPFQPRLYESLLPQNLQQAIKRLWGNTMLPRWPESIVSQPFSHAAMADAFGPALQFWHGCALTAWFVIEGYSRTDMPGLSNYYAVELAALEKAGTPIDSRLFEELIETDKLLGPGEPYYENQSQIEVVPGFEITTSISHGNRRTGFEKLRDIVTRYRNAWTSQYLEVYLRDRWEAELRQVQRDYNVAIQERGKPPTAKQFSKAALKATNHWYGGDLSALYAAIGEKCPLVPQRRNYMPADLKSFTKAVLNELRIVAKPSIQEISSQQREYSLEFMAQMCLGFIQLEEALGTMPRRQEFTSLNADYYWPLLADTLDDAVQVYGNVIHRAKRLFPKA